MNILFRHEKLSVSNKNFMMQKMVIENSKILSLDPIISPPKNIFFVNKIIQFYHQIHIFYYESFRYERGIFGDKFSFVEKYFLMIIYFSSFWNILELSQFLKTHTLKALPSHL